MASEVKVAVIDTGDPEENMYGCRPCPKCGSKYRAPFRRGQWPEGAEFSIECDDCGFREPGRRGERR